MPDGKSRAALFPVHGTLRRLLSQKLAFASLLIALLYLGIAIFAEFYTSYCAAHRLEPVYQVRNEALRNAPPSREHLLGTDYLGRDVFYRAVFAAKTAVKVGVIASVIATFFGVLFGILAGYFGGTVDDIVVWIYSTFAAMPSLLFILAFALLVSKGFLSESMKSAFDAAAFALCLLHGTKRGCVDLPARKRRQRVMYAGIGQPQASSVLAPFLDQADGVDALRRPPVPLTQLGALRFASQRRTAAQDFLLPVKHGQPSLALFNDGPHTLTSSKSKVVKNV